MGTALLAGAVLAAAHHAEVVAHTSATVPRGGVHLGLLAVFRFLAASP
jgi:hypothetical protein